MLPDEITRLTPAQTALIDLIRREDANTFYDAINTTLSLAMVHGSEPDHSYSPSPSTLEEWYFVLLLMRHIHAIAAERPG